MRKVFQKSQRQAIHKLHPPKKVQQPKTKPLIKKKKKEVVHFDPNAKIIIGSIEPVRVLPGDVVIISRIDTGAKTTSLDAVDMQLFERDGREFVRFKLGRDSDAPVIDKPVWKRVKVKRHGGEAQSRPVIKLRLILGAVDQVVLVTLADRSEFQYPLLIGRNFLRDTYIVDVAKKETSQPKAYKK